MNTYFKRRFILIGILWILMIFLVFYLALPAFNVTAYGFWVAILLLCWLLYYLLHSFHLTSARMSSISFPILALFTLTIVMIYILFLPIRIPEAYHEQLPVERISLEQDLPDTNLKQLPRIDKKTAKTLGDKQKPIFQDPLVTQQEYTLILQNGIPYRISSLEYNAIIHGNAPIPGFIKVNTLDPTDVSFVTVPNGIVYHPTAYGIHNLKRHLRLQFPSALLGTPTLEIDTLDHPYWVVPEITIQRGIGGTDIPSLKTVSATFVINAVSGETTRYALGKQPEWITYGVDQNVILDQINSYGQSEEYNLLRSLFHSQNSLSYSNPTHIILDNNIYLVTNFYGEKTAEQITKGWMLVNTRTGTAKLLTSSQEIGTPNSVIAGLIQDKNKIFDPKTQTTSIPIPCKINGKATYLTYLKGAQEELRYALTPAQNTTEHAISDFLEGLEVAYQRYTKLEVKNMTSSTYTEEITISQINKVFLDNKIDFTYTLRSTSKSYILSSSLTKKMLKLHPGDIVSVTVKQTNDSYEIIAIEKKK